MKLRTILIILSLIALCSTLPGIWFHYNFVRKVVTQEADNRASVQALALRDHLSNFLAGGRKAVAALAADQTIADALAGPDADRLATASLILDNFAQVVDSGVCLIADRDGKIVASSRRREKGSGVGSNIRSRDYFQAAMTGETVMHIPFGETTADFRVFFSAPAYAKGSVQPVGVAVIRGGVDLANKGGDLAEGETWVLTDRSGIIYAGSDEKMLYQVLWEKTPARIAQIESMKHLGKGPWGWLEMKPVSRWNCVDPQGNTYRYEKVFVETSPGWDIVYLTDRGALVDKFYGRLVGHHVSIPLALLLLVWVTVILMYRRGSSDLGRRRQAEEKLQKQNEYLRVLSETTLGLISRVERSVLLETIISRAGQLTGTADGFIYLYDIKTDELQMHYGAGAYRSYTGSCVKPGEGFAGTVFQSSEFLHIEDYAAWDGRREPDTYDGLHSVIGFPLSFERENIGVIGLGHFETDGRFGEAEIAILERFARLASVVLYNMRLYEQLSKELHDREKAQNALRISEKRYREFFNEDISGAYISRPDGRLVACNPAFAKMFGFESPAQAGEADMGLMYAVADDRLQFLSELRRGGRVQNYQSRLRKNDGTPMHVIESAVGVFDDQGELTEIRGYIQDITERKNLESQLRQTLKMEAVGTLAGGIAHDFNNLLMAIEGNASLMRMDMERDHPHRQKIENIEKHVKNGSRLTTQLLGYARKGRYEIRTIDLNTLVCETAETLVRPGSKVTVELDLAAGLYPVKADKGQIGQVLYNLLANALEAMPDGGCLALKTANGTEKLMSGRIYRPRPGNYVMLTVGDDGIGMDRQTRDRIFDPFFTTKEMGQGAGLGMASVYGIIKGHTGYIDVDSMPGEGTTFSICLPASQGAVPGEKEAEDGKPAAGQGTVLLVDDEAVILEVGKEYLKYLGYTVHTARGGRDALAIFTAEASQIDLVILDLVMPDISGGEVYDRLKLIDRDVKVLLSSGYSLDGQAAEILERGCNGFIQKPFGMEELSSKIEAALGN